MVILQRRQEYLNLMLGKIDKLNELQNHLHIERNFIVTKRHNLGVKLSYVTRRDYDLVLFEMNMLDRILRDMFSTINHIIKEREALRKKLDGELENPGGKVVA